MVIIYKHSLYMNEHCGESIIYVEGSVYVNPFYGIMENQKKGSAEGMKKREGLKVRDNFLVRPDLKKIFNIEDHVYVRAKGFLSSHF